MFLHQTTTVEHIATLWKSCILSCSYIKPQLKTGTIAHLLGCILSCSYIKPQPLVDRLKGTIVVYYHVPTSNHNVNDCYQTIVRLYIIMFLHQTTTSYHEVEYPGGLYIIMFLHQTTTCTSLARSARCCILSCSYIKPQLRRCNTLFCFCCILSCSYIKPQQSCFK